MLSGADEIEGNATDGSINWWILFGDEFVKCSLKF